MVWYVKIFHLKTFQLFCLNDKGDRMCKVLTLFTLDSLWQVSVHQLWLILFVAMQSLTGCICKLECWCTFQRRNQVWIHTESSWIYIQMLNFSKFVKACSILASFSCSGSQKYWRWNTREMNHESLLESQEGGSTISPSLLEPSHLRDIGHKGHIKFKAYVSKLDFLRSNHIQIAQFPVGVLYTCFP